MSRDYGVDIQKTTSSCARVACIVIWADAVGHGQKLKRVE